MNKFNLLRNKKLGLITEITDVSGGRAHFLINQPGAGIRTGYAAPPHLFEIDQFTAATAHLSDPDKMEFIEKDESCALVARVLMALARQGKAVADVATNNRLTQSAKQEIAVEAVTVALTSIGQHYAALLDIGAKLDAQEKAIYAAPEADTADAIVDTELRGRFGQASEPGQIQIAAKLGEPSMQRLLLALQRTSWPYEGKPAELIRDAWMTRCALEKQEAVTTYTIARENHTWAVGITKHIASILSNANSGTNGGLPRFEQYKLLKPTGGLSVLDFSDSEIKGHERHLLQAAA